MLSLLFLLWLAPSTALVRPLLVPGTVRYSAPRTVVARAAPLRASGSSRPWFFDAERSKAVAERVGADGSVVGAVGFSVVGVCLLVSSVFRTVFTTLVPLGSALPLRRLAVVLGVTLLMSSAVVLGPPILVLGLWRLWTSAPVQRCVQERKTRCGQDFLPQS